MFDEGTVYSDSPKFCVPTENYFMVVVGGGGWNFKFNLFLFY
jgi:hypothetical protein